MRLGVPEQILPADQLGAVHFIGIGGAGLSAIARLMATAGAPVSGSDRVESAVLAALRSEGIRCFAAHDAAHVAGADTVVVSTAVPEDNVEVAEARRLGLRVWPRSAGLQSVLAGHRTIAVAGTHGKTTTAAMLTMALIEAGADPSWAIGAQVASLGSNAHAGDGAVFVAEADESDGAFLVYTPAGAVVTNVDADHLDNYGSFDAYVDAFGEFVSHIGEFVVLCADDPGAARLADAARRRGLEVITAGFVSGADIRGCDLEIDGDHTTFGVVVDEEPRCEVTLQVPGEHYALDALLALAAGRAAGGDLALLVAGLARFGGVSRRMERLGEAAGVRVYDSYAHHPTEIRADLAAARGIAGRGRLVVAFQPHLVSRTRIFGSQMGTELGAADVAVVADIYRAREESDPDVTPALILDAIDGAEAIAGGDLAGVVSVLLNLLEDGDLLLTLGAGDITTVGPQVLSMRGDR